MSKSSIKKPVSIAIGTAIVSSLSATNLHASDNPFVLQDIDGGFMHIAMEGKCGEGKCGEGKCGEGKCGEGKCGEGKCGGMQKMDKTPEGKCGEGQSISHVEGTHFRLQYKSDVTPLPLFRIHSWAIHLETLDKKPVTGARINVYGGMPAHRHGLPTQPMIKELGNGDYLLEGLKFSMTGEWEIWFDIKANNMTEKAVIKLTL